MPSPALRATRVATAKRAIELSIAFAGSGVDTTRAVSPEEVLLGKGRARSVGQWIEGTVRFRPALDRSAPVLLRYAARVVAVAPAPGDPDGGALEVAARCERLEFAPPSAAPDGR